MNTVVAAVISSYNNRVLVRQICQNFRIQSYAFLHTVQIFPAHPAFPMPQAPAPPRYKIRRVLADQIFYSRSCLMLYSKDGLRILADKPTVFPVIARDTAIPQLLLGIHKSRVFFVSANTSTAPLTGAYNRYWS